MSKFKNSDTQKSVRTVIAELGMCPCGSFQQWEVVQAVLRIASIRESVQRSLVVSGQEFPPLAVEFVAKVMSSGSWNLLDHGTSVLRPWLTERGSLLMEFFEEFGIDEDDWPEWWMNFSETKDSDSPE